MNESAEKATGIGTALVPLAGPAGSAPLPSARMERYCWLRAAQQPKASAYRSAVNDDAYGFHAARGNGSRWERRRDVRERIAYLCRQDEELLAWKRAKLEEKLWLIHDANIADMWTTIEVPAYDRGGKPILDREGKPTTKMVQRPKPVHELPLEVQQAIEVITVNENGFAVPKPYSKLAANAELRKFLGLGTIGRGLDGDDIARVPTDELIATLAKDARELGIQIDLNYRFGNQGP